MKPKSLLLLFVAGTCGLIAAIFTAQHLTGKEPVTLAAPVEEHKSVVIAVKDIPAGDHLKEDMLKVVELPTKDLPEGTFTATAELTGQRLRFPVFKGEPVLAGKLGRGSSLARELGLGMVAGYVPVSPEDRPMTGLINPGDRVDVSWIAMQQDLSSTSVRLLLQDIKVVAVGQSIESEDTDSSGSKDSRSRLSDTYTLEVLPIQNMRLQAALLKGKVRLTLRAKGDTTVRELDEKALDLALNLTPRPIEIVEPTPEPTPEIEPEKWEVEIIKGNEVTTQVLNVPAELNSKSKNPGRN
jgi:pilus assembly protein CpaB